MSVLILAEHNEKHFTPEFFRVLNAARELHTDIHLLIVGDHCDCLVAYASDMLDLQGIIVAQIGSSDESSPEIVAFILSELAKRYSHVLCSASNFGKAVFPRVAAHIDSEMQSSVSQIFSPNIFGRSIFAGRVTSKVRVDDAVKLLLINAASFPPANLNKRCDSAWPEIVDFKFELPADLRSAQIVSQRRTSKETVSLQNAEVVIGVGRGVINSERDLAMVEKLARSIGAAVGATRAVVDAGWLPSDKQIGQTAKCVSPNLYLALGISGATQHLAGMKNSRTIVSINRDPEAPIFDVTDFAMVADLKDVMPELCERLGADIQAPPMRKEPPHELPHAV